MHHVGILASGIKLRHGLLHLTFIPIARDILRGTSARRVPGSHQVDKPEDVPKAASSGLYLSWNILPRKPCLWRHGLISEAKIFQSDTGRGILRLKIIAPNRKLFNLKMFDCYFNIFCLFLHIDIFNKIRIIALPP